MGIGQQDSKFTASGNDKQRTVTENGRVFVVNEALDVAGGQKANTVAERVR